MVFLIPEHDFSMGCKTDMIRFFHAHKLEGTALKNNTPSKSFYVSTDYLRVSTDNCMFQPIFPQIQMWFYSDMFIFFQEIIIFALSSWRKTDIF